MLAGLGKNLAKAKAVVDSIVVREPEVLGQVISVLPDGSVTMMMVKRLSGAAGPRQL